MSHFYKLIFAISIIGNGLCFAEMQIQEPSKRGVYYFDGEIDCQLKGVGSRGSKSCVRVALDDDNSLVKFDSIQHRISIVNSKSYPKTALIGDVYLNAEGTDKTGKVYPLGIHVKIEKKKNKITAKSHAHFTTYEKMVSAHVNPFEVFVSNGTSETLALSLEHAKQTVLSPAAVSKLVNALVKVKANNFVTSNNSQGVKKLKDFSVGAGLGPLAKMVLRAEISSLDGRDYPNKADLIKSGNWEIKLTTLSHLIPQDEFKRELFLYGLETSPVLQKIKSEGLKSNDTLTMRMKDGKGWLQFNSDKIEINNAADVARSFLEFNFVGLILLN